MVPIKIEDMPNYTIIMDFLMKFFKDEQDIDTLIIVIYKFTKRIALILDKKTWTAKE
jgi:hypothetical protein